MPLPQARTVPTALLAKGKSHLSLDDLPGFGPQPPANAGAFAPIPSTGKQDSAGLQIESALADVSPAELYELGLTTAAMGFHTAAIEALRECSARAPDHADAWRKLAELLRLAREDSEADAADAAAEIASGATDKWKKSPDEWEVARFEKSERKLREKFQGTPPEEAMAPLREHLVANPRDVVAMRMLAYLEKLAGDQITALRLLERALDICPSYVPARENYAVLLMERRADAAAAPQTALLVAQAPRNEGYRDLYAHALVHTGKTDIALEIWANLLRENPGNPEYWLSYAQGLHFSGRRDESVQAYRQCLALQPDLGEAYWGLADLKGKILTETDIAHLRAQLDGDELAPDNRMYMLYALAHTLERAGDFAASFAAYEKGAQQACARLERKRKSRRRADFAEDRQDAPKRVRRMKEIFSRKNLETKLVQAPAAATPDTPLFVIGLPRAGSTLVEQILASHSQVEGTQELPLIGDIMRDLALSRMLVVPNAYPDCILDLTRNQVAALGARYIERSHDYRQTECSYFVDKRPWNWLAAGLIHLILPHAKIIDIRREPMAACFGIYKQLIPDFAHDLAGLGHYYNKYVSMMEHWQSVLPGRIHFVRYERLVDDTENEIRRMLDYCGLPFEESCLRFWETERTVATPSAEQVRRPIYRDAVEQWRNFEAWLGPLKEALSEPAEV